MPVRWHHLSVGVAFYSRMQVGEKMLQYQKNILVGGICFLLGSATGVVWKSYMGVGYQSSPAYAVDFMLVATTYANDEEDYDRAIAFANRAVAIGAKWYETYATLGDIYERAGKYELALDAYQAALVAIDVGPGIYGESGNKTDRPYLMRKTKEMAQKIKEK